MLVEEGTYISSHKGELLNSKNEWHQAKIIRTTTRVVQGGADVLQRRGGRDQARGVGGVGAELRFVATVTTGGRVKFEPAV